MTMVKHKICLLGAFAVGKTSLVERFVNDRFSDKYLTTVGIRVSQKIMPPVTTADSKPAGQHNFLIWDIAGLESITPVVLNYFRGASGALAVADLTRPETTRDLETICAAFFEINPEAALVTIGNKTDLIDNEGECTPAFTKLADRLNCKLILASAKTGEHVEDAFRQLSLAIELRNG